MVVEHFAKCENDIRDRCSVTADCHCVAGILGDTLTQRSTRNLGSGWRSSCVRAWPLQGEHEGMLCGLG